MPAVDDIPGAIDPDWAAFTALDRMTDHWDRPGWRPGRSAYYWYLSFRDQYEVQTLAEQCQTAVAGPHFDLVERSDLHMTVERVAFADEINRRSLKLVAENATRELVGYPELMLQIGPLAGSSGALSFSVTPQKQLRELRLRLLAATHSAGFAQDVDPSNSFRPHVGIGYCNRTIDARPIIDQVRPLRSLPSVSVCIREVDLVVLTRHEHAYSWKAAHRLSLKPRD